MKKIFFVVVTVLLLSISRTYGLDPVATDLWDITQGVLVTDHSSTWHSYYSAEKPEDIYDMFGGYNFQIPSQRGYTLFSDDYGDGYMHWVEWQTPSPITLTNFNLFAVHDDDTYPPFNDDGNIYDGSIRDANYRGFKEFSLYAEVNTNWEKLYEYYPSNPYNPPLGGPEYNILELSGIVTPTNAQKFRAEFVQKGTKPSAAGPRILELDGFSIIPLPEPSETIPEGILPISLDQSKEQIEKIKNSPDAHLENLLSEPLDPKKSTILLTHGMDGVIDGSLYDWITPMAESIKERLGSDLDEYNLLAWDWEKYAKVSYFSGVFSGLPTFFTAEEDSLILKIAKKQGQILADVLYGDDYNYTNNLHLIGHSAGGTVIEKTAGILKDKGVDIAQLTYLDAPGAISGSAADWADNYIGPFGNPLVDSAYNYYLSIPKSLNLMHIKESHAYAHDFYEYTVDGPNNDDIAGFFDDKGFYWSKEIGGKRPFFGVGFQDVDYIYEKIVNVVTTIAKETFDSVGNWLKEKTVDLIDGAIHLIRNSATYLFSELTIPLDANYFNFDFKFDNLGDGDYLSVHFNDNLLFWFEGTQFYGDDFWNSDLIDISPYAGQTGIWTFALDGIGDVKASVFIDNLEFNHVDFVVEQESIAPVPEPSTWLMLGIGLTVILLTKKRFFNFI